MKDRPHAPFGVAITINFLIMWALTYVGVAAFGDFLINVNRFYTAAVMVAPMVIVMLTAMRHML